jgi:hypothetical protein
MNNALTWDELADYYNKFHSGGPARTLPMNEVRLWAENRTDLFYQDPVETTLHLRKIDKSKKGIRL